MFMASFFCVPHPPFLLPFVSVSITLSSLFIVHHHKVARLLLNQLDAMFGTVSDPHPASNNCLGFPHDETSFLVQNWKDIPFAHGAYSFPTLGARQGLRAEAFGSGGDDDDSSGSGGGGGGGGGQKGGSTSSDDEIVFFAGEHTSPGVNACIHGAMITGTNTAKRVAKAIVLDDNTKQQQQQHHREQVATKRHQSRL